MSRFLSLLILAMASQIVRGEPAVEMTCELSVERPISFVSPSSHDKVIVAIGSGPCYLAQLEIKLMSEQGKVLYVYSAPFKQHIAEQWDSLDLPRLASEFVVDTAEHGIVGRSDLPNPLPRGRATESNSFELQIPSAEFKRLIKAGQPVFHHATYYEGGRFVMFTPKTNRTIVAIVWGY